MKRRGAARAAPPLSRVNAAVAAPCSVSWSGHRSRAWAIMAALPRCDLYALVFRAWAISQRLIARNRWSKERLAAHQRKRLTAIVQHAARRSPFYRAHYRGLRVTDDLPLQELPVITKQTIMENFDRVVTDPRLRLTAIAAHLAQAKGDALFLNEYRALSTSGTTGLKGLFVYSKREWSVVLADTLRWQHTIGVKPRLPRRLRLATIGAGSPSHVSYRLVASGDVGLFNMKRLDATAPIPALVAALNAFAPDVLLSYPTVAALLAIEQIEGRLAIAPAIISTHSETLSPGMSAIIERARGIAPFDHYGLSEHPNCGCACAERRGIHLFEDLFLAEVVDDRNRPVAPGETGLKLLLTNLYNFTQPLIRYEVSDMLSLSAESCPCGRPFRLVSRIAGRSDDIVYLRGLQGDAVPVLPLHFYDAIEAVEAVKQYRIFAQPGEICVEIAARAGADCDALAREVTERLTRMLHMAGAAPPSLRFAFVDTIKPSPALMGKAKLIVSRDTMAPSRHGRAWDKHDGL